MRLFIKLVTFLSIFPLQSGCDTQVTTPTSKSSTPVLRRLPAELKVAQRTTTRVPGSQGSLHITIDDITRGQVMVTLIDSDGKPVLATTSMQPDSAATFTFGDATYQIKLTELDNSLTGEDYATFVISASDATAATSDSPTEDETIERLLDEVESSEGSVFIRNGKEYPPKEAADHLRMKWKSAGGKVTTADEFIDKIATKSSMSNEAYRVRKPDGTEVESAIYLREKLREINANR